MDSGYGYQALLNQSDVDASRVTFTGLDPDSLLCTSSSGTLTTAVVGSGLSFVGGILVSTASAAYYRSLLSAGTGIGYDSSTGVITNTGVVSLSGTSNQIAASAATGAVTLSLPQDIGLTSNVTFGNIAGTLTTSSQPNIVTLASVTDLNGIPIGANTLGNSSTSLVCGSLQLTTSPGVGKVLTSDASGNATWSAAAGAGVTSITGTANQVIASASTGAVTLSTPQSIGTASNVQFGSLGIGTAPVVSLDVLGNTNAGITGRIKNSNAGSSAYTASILHNDGVSGCAWFMNSSTRATDGGVNTATLRNDAGGLRLLSSGSNGVNIAATTGNTVVGSNSITPTQILQVGNAGRLRISNGTTDYSLLGTIDVDGSTNTRVVVSGNTRASFPGQIDYVATSTGSHVWYTGGTSLRMTLLSSGFLGLGAAAPAQMLEQRGNHAVGHRWDGAATTTDVKIGTPGNGGAMATNDGSAWFLFKDSSTVNVNQGTSIAVNTHQWGVGTIERVRFAANGNVGIGTTVPTHKLDVLGDIKTYSSANDVMLLVSPNSGNYIRIDAWNQANSVQKPIVLNQTGGNVGIGIVNPTTTLQLWNGSKGGQISLGQQGDPTPYMNMGMDTSWQQYICNNAQWTGSAYNYVSTGGYGGKASRICQENGNIYFDVAYGGSNPITWDRRLNIQNSGAVICGGTFSAPTVNATSNLQKNGTNIVTMMMTTGSWALTGATARYSANHNLGAMPTFIQFHYVCTTANFNWAVGDRLPVSCDAQVSDHVGNPWFDGSLIGFYFSDPPRLIAMDKFINAVRQLTTASWSMEWRAFRSI